MTEDKSISASCGGEGFYDNEHSTQDYINPD